MRLLKLLVVLALCLCLSVTVFAHPGKTDSQGGHTDHSTGEYHYHHGYSAHQHYDSDGDGDLDCPYDFDDQTGLNSGESSKTETHVAKLYPDEKPITEQDHKEDTEEGTKKEKTVIDQIKAALGFVYDILMFCFALFFGFMCLLVVIEMIVQIFRWLFRH